MKRQLYPYRAFTLALVFSLGFCSVHAGQQSFQKTDNHFGWNYSIDFQDSESRLHSAHFSLSQADLLDAKTLLKKPDQILKKVRHIGNVSKNRLENDLTDYAEYLWQDILSRTFRYADELVEPLPSGSRIYFKIVDEDEGLYEIEGNLARDFRFWKYDEYQALMARAIEDLEVYFRQLAEERLEAIDLYRQELQHALQKSMEEVSDQLFNQGLMVKNSYRELRIDYRAAVRESLWHLRDLSFSLDSIGATRERVNKILGFFQSIPYEAIEDNRHEAASLGFRMPAVTIDQNLGDCDSKTVGMAAVLKNLMPNHRTLLVLVPGHAFLAMQLVPKPRDNIVLYLGSEWVLMEPVGPYLSQPGQISPESLEKLKSGIGVSYVEL